MEPIGTMLQVLALLPASVTCWQCVSVTMGVIFWMDEWHGRLMESSVNGNILIELKHPLASVINISCSFLLFILLRQDTSCYAVQICLLSQELPTSPQHKYSLAFSFIRFIIYSSSLL